MQGTPKPTASLSSGLLARRGHARPAMRPQGFVSLTPAQSDDLGWNDMGEEAAAPQPVAVTRPVAVAPPAPPVLRQLAALDEQFSAEPVSAARPAAPAPLPAATLSRVAREASAKKTKAAFTLRLDSDRHLRLRLATAVRHQSAQQIVTEALDAFLESLTEVDALARQLAAREGRD